MHKKKRLEIIGISNSQTQSGAYALILGEVDGERRLPIIIGGYEAQAIAIELEKMKPNRPLTHDLFKNFADEFNIIIKEVIIDKFAEGIFFAKLICVDSYGEREIDSRTSDAVALAIRFNCNIYTNEEIIDDAGIVMDKLTDVEDELEDENFELENEFSSFSVEELESMLSTSIEKEEYERASKISDELNHRKST